MKCPVCENESGAVLRPAGAYHLVYCDACHVRFSDPMSPPGQQWYEESDIYEEVRWNVPSVSNLGGRWEFDLALKQLNEKRGRVFDVGCGRGDFLKLAEVNGFNATGVDFNRTLVRVAREAYGLSDVHAGSLESYRNDHPNDKFIAVTAFEVMEHLPDPLGFLRECATLLEKDGKLMISVPGYHRWPAWVNSEVDLPPHHLVLWSEKALWDLFEKIGLVNVRTYRKPLQMLDIMYHAVRKFPWVQAPGKLRRIVRGLLKIALVPVWLAMRMNPRAGGFTLFVVGDKHAN